MPSKHPVVIARRYGKEYMRSRPDHVKQTEASIKTASSFGKTSAVASQLVSTFKPLIGTNAGQRIYHRLLAALVKWQQEQLNSSDATLNTSCLKGFQFVQQGNLAKVCKINYGVRLNGDGMVNIELPGFVPVQMIKAPRGCATVTMKWMAVSCQLALGELLGMQSAVMVFDYNNDIVTPQQLQLQVPVAEGCLQFVAMAIFYSNINTMYGVATKDLQWLPGGVVSSLFD